MDYFVAPESRSTPRLTLRSYLPGDGAALNEATLSSYEHLRPWMPWVTDEQTPDDAERLVREFRGRWLLAKEFVVAIFSPDGAELMGGAGFHLRDGGLGERTAEMGMWIRASRAGQGLGAEALNTLIDWGFAEWPWVRLTWKCDTRNTASRKVAEAAGMRLEATLRQDAVGIDGVRRDTACYAVLRSERSA